MTDEGFRKAAMNGVLLMLTGMFIAGFPLVWVVSQTIYGVPGPVAPGGDYRGWVMAHLEGLLNGMMLIALASVTRGRPMSAGTERILLWSLAIAAWGNTIASVLAPILGVRGMIPSASSANNLVYGLFTVAFVATVISFGVVLRQLWGRTRS
jgi:hypothetical protein